MIKKAGGLPEKSTILISGSAGTGKTILGCSFCVTGQRITNLL
ncbi:MAG: hypothetical protein DRO89_03475 [Candidatus Altiarchaeales archaeon]|nr:MAG: hypothetical protein DRO89_03475 [Candidatus Altiarchaeales archaeon]